MDAFCCFYGVHIVVVFTSILTYRWRREIYGWNKQIHQFQLVWHTDATKKYWYIQVTGLIEHKVQMSLVTVTVNNRSDYIGIRLSKTSVISWIRLLISNGSRSVSLAGESSGNNECCNNSVALIKINTNQTVTVAYSDVSLQCTTFNKN